jgi:hypothetical protein
LKALQIFSDSSDDLKSPDEYIIAPIKNKFLLAYEVCCSTFVVLLVPPFGGLKGNRVRIPDSPAAVFSTTAIQSKATVWSRFYRDGWEGRVAGSKSEDLPEHLIHSFRGLKLRMRILSIVFPFPLSFCLLWQNHNK